MKITPSGLCSNFDPKLKVYMTFISALSGLCTLKNVEFFLLKYNLTPLSPSPWKIAFKNKYSEHKPDGVRRDKNFTWTLRDFTWAHVNFIILLLFAIVVYLCFGFLFTDSIDLRKICSIFLNIIKIWNTTKFEFKAFWSSS